MKKMMRFIRNIVLLAVVLSVALLVTGQSDWNVKELFSSGNSDGYASQHIYLLDRDSGKAVFEKDATSKAYPASLTKIMTTLVALEHIDDLSAGAPVDVQTYQAMVAQNASMAGFYGREAVTYRDLLYGTMLPSGGEAANSLAINVAGSREKFVRLMNEKAAALGMTKTHYSNPEGLHDPEQYTTAADMAKLLDHALGNQNFRAIFTKPAFTTTATADHPAGIQLKSTVLSSLHPEEQHGFTIIGGKSGTTYEAGQCWATLSTADGREYINVVMGAPLEDVSHPDFAQKRDTLKLLGQAVAGGFK
ncbi:D-alanyl-D-alanine carboxypeptidase family protein [Sporosarcina sp. NCCP-2716]|uniref:D-alanyl-D-alanine carboxypeptidase family protein n=1 Tax=Sporosarcina sp. NCCP-2716 TaxID=2943679 RepID=UPI00203FB9E5|nr:serine hydrolase [Sporosarcina sp. NCCP-2716]